MPEIEHKKRCACKHFWWVRRKPTASAEKANRFHPTWEEWFERTFGEPMASVWARIQADNIKAKNEATMKFYGSIGR